ncbi:MAG: MFS transporter [Thermaerobacter sp.]|nr:MFS transporter [Thermaerobacter sp.]
MDHGVTARPNYRMLTIYLTGIFMGALDTNVVGPVFTLITHSFRVSLGWTAWTVTAYTVAYIASTVLAGAVGDRMGHKRMFVLGIVAFGLASVLAAVSPVFWVFVAARAIQGIGAGAVYPNAQAEGIRQFPPEKKGMALGIFGAVFGIASIVGPTVGGILGQFLGWPAVFLVNVPIALGVLVVARRLPSSDVHARPLPDVAGGLSFSAMLAMLLLFVMITSNQRWVFLAVGLVLVGSFISRQRRAAVPFLDTRPLANSAGIAMMAGAALIGLDMSAAIFVPTLVQRALHFSVVASGLALLPAAFSGALLSGVGGVMTDRVGPRKVLTIGLVAGAGGGLLLAWPPLVMVRFILAMILLGTGTAFTMGAPLNRMALALYRDDQAGEALSLIAVFRGIGVAAGPIILTSAQVFHGFTGMFGSVFVASLVGVVAFLFVPNVRPAPRAKVAPEG